MKINPPATQVVNKPCRMTANKRRILDALAELGGDFAEYGTPPYAVGEIARHLYADLSNTAKTLRLLERAGLVVREMARRECWNAISLNHVPRRCACYWLAATMTDDQARAAVWRAGAGDRAEAAWANMFGAQRQQPALHGGTHD